MNKAMRHNASLPVHPSGFCYLNDLIHVLPTGKNGLPRKPSLLECMYIIQTEKIGRFEGTCIFGPWPPEAYDVLARCVQGHSKSLARALSDDEVRSPYTKANCGDGLLIHYTNDKLLYPILRHGCIVPGGLIKDRDHVFISRHRVSDTGVIPDSFHKRGVNIGVELDGATAPRCFATAFRCTLATPASCSVRGLSKSST